MKTPRSISARAMVAATRFRTARVGGALPGIDIDQLSLSLGVDAGSLRGAIVGHVLRSDDPLLIGKKWTALDLGVSWRTPWRGEISVGAQNLWSAPLDRAARRRSSPGPHAVHPVSAGPLIGLRSEQRARATAAR